MDEEKVVADRRVVRQTNEQSGVGQLASLDTIPWLGKGVPRGEDAQMDTVSRQVKEE